MEIDHSRRRFLRHDVLVRPAAFIVNTVRSFNEGRGKAGQENYFDSLDYCYPLIAEAGDMLLEEAEKRGIETQGKDKPEIARELFRSGYTAALKEKK